MPPTVPHRDNHAAMAAANDSETYFDNGAGRTVSQSQIKRTKQLVGQALADRRSLARDRILRGGWTTRVTEAAVELTANMVWKEISSYMTCIQEFCHKFAGLGDFCVDLEAIGSFLDAQLHKLIAFRAMEKDFQIPGSIIRKADQKNDDGVFKYAWFRSVLQELQGVDTGAAAIWLQPYRADGEQTTTGDCDSRPVRVNQVVGRKRARDSLEEVDMNISPTKIKVESIEDISPDRYSPREHPRGTTSTAVEDNHGESETQVDRRTLTVLFHGMGTGRDGAKESEHVQVYVPRTARGVTINFL